MIKLSVIVPVYRVPQGYLRKCLDSLAGIELRDIEIIMVDDGSPDDSGDICDEYAGKDSRFVAIHTENAGVSAARNRGIRESRGERIIFVDADDWVEPESIKKLVERAFETDPDILLFAGFLNKGAEQREGRFGFAEGKAFDPDELNMLIRRTITIYALPVRKEEILPLDGVWGKMYRASLLKDNSVAFPEGIPVSEDGLFFLHALKKAERVVYVGECAYHYRVNEEGAMRRFRPGASLEQGLYLEKLFEYVRSFGDKGLEDTYYLRVLVSLRHCMEQKYFHPKNTDGYLKRRRDFLRLTKEEPYRTALRQSRLYKVSKTLFLRTLLTRLRLPGLLMLMLRAKGLIARADKKIRAGRKMTRILLVSECCTDKRYEEMLRAGLTQISASQFMLSGLIKGFSECGGVSVTVLSGLRMKSPQGRIFRKRERDSQYGFEYIYPSEIALSGLHLLWSWLRIFLETARWCRNNRGKECFVICDALLNCAIPARLAARLFGVLTVAFVTDLPQLMNEIDEGRYGSKLRLVIGLLSRMLERDMVRYDRYIALTEGLNREANPKDKPHIIVECIMDVPHDAIAEREEEKDFVVMFAGKTNRLFGMELLLEAIPLIKREDISFHIYGKGNYDEAISEAAKKDRRIVQKGLLPRSEVLVKERQADLLINLRPSAYKFAIYSFPSKVAEYMASGTPVLTTRLPGIPEEYGRYLWYLDREEPEGVARAIEKIMDTPKEERLRLGRAARRFIEESKNPRRQAGRIIGFLTGEELGEAVWSK